MTREELISFVTALVPEMKPGTNKQFPEAIIPPANLHELASTLKTDPSAQFDYLFCQTAADRKDGFHVVYFLQSTQWKHTLMLKVILSDKVNPVVDSVSDIWRAAEFHEREMFDLFGIRFNNHPDLRRIFLEDDWVGYPLRKDYKDSFTIER